VVENVVNLISRGLRCGNKEIEQLVDDKLFIFWLPEKVVSKQISQQVVVLLDLRMIFTRLSALNILSHEGSNRQAVLARDSFSVVEGPGEQVI